MTEIQDTSQRALELAFRQLRRAEDRFQEPTIPHTPLGRPRVFRIARFFWPVKTRAPGGLRQAHLGFLQWTGKQDNARGAPGPYSFEVAIIDILNWTGNQPRRVWRVIRQINAVIAWCEKRAAGRKRAAEEILRQQAPWISKIEAEVLVEELTSGTKTEKLTPAPGSFRRGLR